MNHSYSSLLARWVPRPLAALGLLLATVGAARAQTPAATFATVATYGTGTTSSPRSIAAADVNGDGKLDLLTVNQGSNTAGVQLGNGDGSFGTVTTFSTGPGSQPLGIAVADVNGDGKPDLLTANQGSSGVGVLLGTGTGSFGTVTTFSTGSTSLPASIAVADVNGDGKLDLLTANRTSNSAGVLLGNGDGSFRNVTIFNTGGNSAPYSIAVADVNGDGKLDLLTANINTNTAGVLLGTGTGSFGTVTTFSTGPTSTPLSIAVADVNGDGKPDLLTANQGSNSAGVLLGTGTGSFGNVATFSTGPTSTPIGITVADVNGDGKLDLLTANQGSNSAGVLLGNGDGTFGAATTYGTGTTSSPRSIAVADVNGDGKPDLLTANQGSSSAGVLLNTTVYAPALTTISPNPAAVGTSVTLTGTNLTGATGVRFNGTAATTLAVVNSTTVTATVPTGATSGLVTVTTPGGTSNGVVFTVLASPPVLANIEPSPVLYVIGQTFPQTVTGTLTVSDADSPNLTGATVTISSGFVANDALYFINQNGISGSYNTGTGVLILTGTASVTTYQAALRSIGFYYYRAPITTPGDRVIRFTVSDGTNPSNAVTRTVRVVAMPTVATAAASSITSTSAVLGGNVTADGGDAVTDRGVVYSSTTTTPTIGGAGVTQDANGTGMGSFSKTIAGLTPGTAYTVRAYAINSAGTSYGSPVSFTTVANTSVVSISRVGGSPTNASSVSFTVTFAAAVTGLSVSNFGLVTTGSVAGASLTSVSGAGTTYTVAVNTGTGDGTLGLNLTNATGLSPGLTNLPFVGQVYTLDKTAPTVTITSPTAPNGGYTTTSPLTFVVTFSEAVMGYNFANIASNISNAASGSVDATAAPTYTVTLVPATAGAVTVSVPAGIVTDAAGNANVAAVPPTYTIYYNVPTATSVLTAPAPNSTSTSKQPTYQGTAPAGSTVTVFVNGTSIGTTTATGGSFSLTQPTALADGQYTVYATAQLSGQAVSAASNTNTFTVTTAPTVTLLSPATGPVGTSVMITGTNLGGTTAVSFNGTAASSFVVNSATSLTAVVAAGTTTGPVRVTTPGGTATSPTSFVVRVAPTTVADSYSTPQGVTLTGNVLSNDLGTNPRAILINRPANGVLVLNPDGTFSYRPNAGFTGLDTFTYYACDPSLPLLCGNPATVSITVLRIAPVTVADAYTTPQNTTLTGNVLTNDLGTNPRAILINRPVNGVLVLNPDGSFSYTPNTGFVGADSFTYYACDPNLPLLCGNPATVSITVVRVAPITVADSYSTPQGVTLTGNVLSNDIGTNPRAILINRPTRGTLALNPDGSFTYRPNAGFTGLDTFTYYACNQGAPLTCGDPATVSITVVPTNTATRVATPSATASATATTPATAAGGAVITLELALTGSPNPFADELQLSFALPIAQAYTLAVYDAQGRLVQQLASGQAEAGQAQQVEVPTHTFAAGLYLVRLTTPTGTQLLKLIKR
jgi:hypothetical protein